MIVWPGHGLGIEEPHEHITSLVIYPCEVWCEEGSFSFHLFFKYGSQQPYRFTIAFEVYWSNYQDWPETFWSLVWYCWKMVQLRISIIEKEARS